MEFGTDGLVYKAFGTRHKTIEILFVEPAENGNINND
jgi:hypothetical protein